MIGIKGNEEWEWRSYSTKSWVPAGEPTVVQPPCRTLCYYFQSLSRVWLFVTRWTATHQAPLSSTTSQSLLKFMSIESVMKYLILCCPLLLLPSSFPSIKVFPKSQLFAVGSQSIGALASPPVYPMNIWNWFPFELLAVQGTLKSLLYHQNLKEHYLILVLTIWWYPRVGSSLGLLEKGVWCDQCVLLTKLCWFCFILYSKGKWACYSGYLLTFYFCISIPCDEKNIFRC